jgi:hypothetical protein
MEQYPIPQFIEKEGRIVPFLTFRQFFILVAGGAAILAAFYVLPFYIFVIVAFVAALVTLAIAFLKIDDRPVLTLVLNFLSFTVKSKNYVWKKKEAAYPFRIKKGDASKVMADFHEAQPGQKNGLQGIKQMVELRKKK